MTLTLLAPAAGIAAQAATEPVETGQAQIEPTASQPAPADQDDTQSAGLENKSLEELLAMDVASVESASRHPQPVTEAPSSVTIITATEIALFGWRTLADVLGSVRGFSVTNDRNYAYVGVRGFGRPTDYNNRILLLIDGHRVNDAIYDGAPIGTDIPIDLALADRIEVIRGPGSALYGTSAFFAVINVITRRGASVGGTEVSADAGSLGTYRMRAAHGWGDEAGRDMLLSVTRYQRHGPGTLYFPEFDTPETNGGRVSDRDGDRATNAYVAFSTGRWRLQGLVGSREKEVPTGSWGTTFGDPRLKTRDTRGWIEGAWRREGSRGAFGTRLYYDHYSYVGSYPVDDSLEHDHADAAWIGGEVTARRALWTRHVITAGIEPRFNLHQDQRVHDEQMVYVDDRRSSRELGGYVQDEIALHPRFTATIGARYDWWSLKGGTGRPRAGLVYRADYDTAIKVLYGEAYRAPNVYELFYGSPESVSRRNESLTPETLRTTEVVFERYIKGRLRVAATGYYTRIRDLIEQTEIGDAVQHHNHERVRSRGVELEAESRSASGLLLRASYVRQQTTDLTSGDDLSNAPHHLGTLQAAVPLWKRRLHLALDATYSSSRQSVSGTELPAYGLANLTATYRPLHSRVSVGVSMRNIFDTTYSHPVGTEFVQDAIQQDGRTVIANVTVRF